ncbi:Deoxyribonuclease-2-alpha [Trichinella sp. T6]|nr:Deoxyribonuclease-2-alpha [Trichinella sp. T6]
MLNMVLLQMHQINLLHTTMNQPDIAQLTNEINHSKANDMQSEMTEPMQQTGMRAILYKAPAKPNGKILHAGAANGNWANSPQPIAGNNGHSFAKALEHVIAVNANNKFISYNNHPPDVPKVRTKSNSKGVLMMDTGNDDAAAWIVHTVPGFPKARTGYLFPPAEVQKGHLLICLTIKEDQIDTIGKC